MRWGTINNLLSFIIIDRSTVKSRLQVAGLEELETIPPHDAGVPLTVESYIAISQYLRKVIDSHTPDIDSHTPDIDSHTPDSHYFA